MSWVRTTILDEKGKCDDGNNEQKCVIILSHAKTDTFKFRCECSRVDSRDRLIVTFIDSVGNLMLFDQLTTKEIVKVINEENLKQQGKHKDVHMYLHNGIIKILLKQKIIQRKTKPSDPQLNSNLSKCQIMNKRIEKLINFLDQRMTIFSKLIEVLNLPGMSKGSSQAIRLSKKLKILELALVKNLKTILKSDEKVVSEMLRQFELSSQKQEPKTGIPVTGSGLVRKKRKCDEKEEQEHKTGEEFEQKNNIYEMQELELDNMIYKTHSGGSSEVEKRKAIKFYYKDPDSQILNVRKDVFLAVKRAKDEQFIKKNERELKIIKAINERGNKKKYLLNYFKRIEQKEQVIYIEYVDLNLNEFLFYYRQFISLKEVFSLSKQVLKILIDLHDINIVYRDMKPSNFLVDTANQLTLKLIDFSDSCTGDQKIDENQRLCGTVPYSPIETSRYYQKYREEGINSKNIDNWSAGILIHQFFYGCFPLTYSSGLAKDILSLWNTEFLYLARTQKQRGLKLIDSVFQLLNLLLVRVNQSERLQLAKALAIINVTQEFYDNIIEIIKS